MRHLKKIFVVASLAIAFAATPTSQAQSQIIEIVTGLITKVIKAIDLEVQRLQTQTIWLQDAQKLAENAMAQLHLDDITGWVQKQKDLYGEYYNELWQIKSYIADYQRVKDIIAKQIALVSAYKSAYALFQKDSHFSADEIQSMYKFYSNLIDQSVKNLEEISLVINAFTTQMSDAMRLKIIDEAGSRIDKNYSDLQKFNQQNILLSLQRSQSENDINTVKQLYGLD